MEQHDNRLLRANLKERTIDNSVFQRAANLVKTRYVTKPIVYTGNSSVFSGDYYVDNRSYMRDEVYALSLVENPAIEADWVYFTEHKEQVKFATVDNDKRTIVAPVLIPDKRIYRVDERTGHEYEVFVTAETIEKLAQQYLMKGYQNKATVEHNKNIDGDVTVVESWVSKSSTKDKSANYFSRIFPAGTWFVTMKVNDEKLWQDYVKTGKVQAISIEGLFGHQLVKAAAIEELMEKDISELTEQ
jgi:hypothetical protein